MSDAARPPAASIPARGDDPKLEPPNEERAQLAALGATPLDAITVTVRRPEPAAAHFAD
jgi:hypothetical protein